MKPAWPWCFHANWPTSSWDTTWAASTPSTIACCSPMNPPTRTWASGTLPRRKLQPTRKLRSEEHTSELQSLPTRRSSDLLGSKYAFYDRMLFSDESAYQNLGFRHAPEEETAADKKALELLKNSPYAEKLNTPGLFLREVAARGPALSALLTPHLGTGFIDRKGAVDRMMVLMNSAPALDPDKLDQIAALPLGGRVKLNAWDDHAELIKTTPLAITSARDKMPLEVTPFSPRLTRSGAVVNPTATARATNPIPSN